MTHHYDVPPQIEELENETCRSTGAVDSVELTHTGENENLPPWRSVLGANELYEQTRKQIATAPELLAALKQCLDALYNETVGCDSPWIESVKQAAIDAITQAEGEAK